jgi:signal transduction histidine kinase
MLNAPIPDNETHRLAALQRYCVLDTPAEPAFDRLVLVAQHLLKVPTVLVSLVDADRQWFKARVGMNATQTPRDTSFCGHAVYLNAVLIVPDATKDERFADNPLVTGDLGLRFYAGAPLITADGHALGSLCAIDYVPRPAPDEADIAMLVHLADAVVAALELRRHGLLKEEQLRQSQVLARIAATAHRASDLRSALGPVLDEWCDFSGFEIAHAYLRFDEKAACFEPSGIWHAADCPAFARLRQATGPIALDQSAELINQVCAKGDPLLITDLSHASGARAIAARQAGMRSALLLPVSAAGRIVCVIECYSLQPMPDHPDWHAATEYVYLQLSRLAERERLAYIKDHFVTTVSHELRTPLTSIAAALELLEDGRGGTLPTKAAHMAHIAHRNCERLTRLVNDILDIGKLESSGMRLQVVPCPLAPLIERAIAETEAFAHGFAVTMAFTASDLPAQAAVDEDRFIQVVTNLLSNAVKFSPSGSVVQIDLVPHHSSWRLSVRDHGSGIPKAFQGRIFEKFAQGGAPVNRQCAGTGLGLAIVQHIVHLHGGEVCFETVLGQGTTFHVDLPASGDAS